MCGIEHWFPCGADGRQRAGGRAVYGHVITKFSVMGSFTYPWCSAGALRAPELRYKDNDQRKARKEDFKKNAEKCFVTLFVTLFKRLESYYYLTWRYPILILAIFKDFLKYLWVIINRFSVTFSCCF